MKYECKITVLETKCFPELQEQYLADSKSGPCPFFKPGDTFLLKRTPQQDDFYHLMNGKFCGEAWDAVSRYVYTALQGGSIMKGWTDDDRIPTYFMSDVLLQQAGFTILPSSFHADHSYFLMEADLRCF